MSATAPQDVPAKNGNGHAIAAIEPVSLLNVIAHALTDGTDLDRLERLFAWQAKITFDEAYALMWAKLPQIVRYGTVDTGKGKYNFAKQEDLDEVIRPILAEHGFALQFRSISTEANMVHIVGTLSRGGHSVSSELRLPPDNGPGRNQLQALGSSISYAQRYITEGLLNLVRRGVDNDGQAKTREDMQQENSKPVDRGSKQQDTKPPAKPQRKLDPDSWLASIVPHLDAVAEDGWQWAKRLKAAAGKAPTLADLEALADDAKPHVAKAPPEIRTEIGAAFMRARKRLSVPAAPAFSHSLVDPWGEVTPEPFADPVAFVHALLALWHKAIPEDAANLIEHNAEAIDAARAFPEAAALLAELDEPPREQKADESDTTDSPPITPLRFEAVRPAQNNGRAAWVTWPNLVRAELGTIEGRDDLDSFVLAQRGVLAEAPKTQRDLVLRDIVAAFAKAGSSPPRWLADVHERWVDDRAYDLKQVGPDAAGRAHFDAMVRSTATQAVMQRIKAENAALFRRADLMFGDKHAKLPIVP